MRLYLGRLALAIAASALVISVNSLGANAQPSVSAPYGAREPLACASRTAPNQGAPSNAEATQYFKCTMEGIGDGRLYLFEDVTLQVAAQGRAYDPQRDYFPNIDNNHLVYPISGSLVRFVCFTLNANNADQNCSAFVETNASGDCYKMISGDWSCNMSDLNQQRTENVAPPQ